MKMLHDLETLCQAARAANIAADSQTAARYDFIALNLNHLLRQDRTIGALEVGCGAGGSYRLLVNRLIRDRGVLAYQGIDAAAGQIATAKADFVETGGCRFTQAEGARLPFDDGAFDFVYEAHLLREVADPLAIASEMIRVSRELVVVTIYTTNDETEDHHPFLTAFLMNEDDVITTPVPILAELDIKQMPAHLLGEEAGTDRRQFVYAKTRRRLPSNDQLESFLTAQDVRLVHREATSLMLDSLRSASTETWALSDADDHFEPIAARQHRLVLEVNK